MKADPALPDDSSIDWSVCTYDGARLANHRQFAALPFAEKLRVIEDLNTVALHFFEQCRRTGRPYRDPYTKERVVPALPVEA